MKSAEGSAVTTRQQREEGHPSTAGPLGQQGFEVRPDVDGWKTGARLHGG